MMQIIFGLDSYFGIKCNGPYLPSLQNNTKKGITRGVRISLRKKSSLSEYTCQVGFIDPLKQSKAECLWASIKKLSSTNSLRRDLEL